MKRYWFFKTDTGEVSAVTVLLSNPDWLAQNTPAGCTAVEGEIDPAVATVDPVTHEPVSLRELPAAVPRAKPPE